MKPTLFLPAVLSLAPALAGAAEILQSIPGPVAGSGGFGTLIVDTASDTNDWITANPVSAGGNGVSLSDPGASGTYYFAFHWLVTDNTGEDPFFGGFYGGLGLYDGGDENGLAGNGWNGRFVGLATLPGDPNTGVEYQVGTSVRIVAHVTFVPFGDDIITLFADPTNAFAEGDQSATAKVTASDNWEFGELYSRAGNGSGAAAISNFAVAIPATAATWDGEAVNSLWTSAANWTGDTAPVAGNALVFPASGSTTPVNDFPAGTAFSGLTFAADAAGYQLGGNAIALSGFVKNLSAETHVVALPLQLAAGATLDSGAGALVLQGVVSGPHGIEKTGGGRVELAADCSYTGGTTIVAGTLAVGDGVAAGSIPGGGTVSFGPGNNTVLEISRGDDVTLSNPISTGGRANVTAVAGAVTLAGSVTGGGEFWTRGPGTVRITPNAGSAGRGASNVLVSGVLEISGFGTDTLGTGNFYLAQGGGGTLRYTGPSVSTTRLGLYALQGGGPATVIEVSQATTDLVFTETLGDIGGGNGLTKAGPGTLTLAAAPGYGGATVVVGGVLSLAQAGLADGANVTVADGAKIDLGFTGEDIVGGLVLGLAPAGPGTYTAASHPAYFTGTGALVVPGGDPFPAWIDSFPALTEPADKTRGADPDHDGLDNLAEFALDGDPSSGAASGKSRCVIVAGHLTLTLPVREGSAFTGGGPLEATLAAESLVYRIGGSATLDSFASGVEELGAPLSGDLPGLSDGWEYRSFRLTTPVTGATRGFLRAEITGLP